MVAETEEEPAGRAGRDGHRAGPEPARVDLDGQDDAEVVQDRRNRGPQQNLQVGHVDVLGDDERGGAQRRRRQDRADAGRGEHAARLLPRVAGAAQDRPGHRTEADRGRGARSGHRAEQEAGQCHGAPRGRAGRLEQREAQVDEEPAGAGGVEHRTVDREQHDVGGAHVQRDAVEAGLIVVEAVDDLAVVDARVADRPRDRQEAAVVGVEEEGHADDRQHQTGGAPAGLQHQHRQDRAHHDVGDGEGPLPVEERVEPAARIAQRDRQHRIEAHEQGDGREHPVEDPGVVPFLRFGAAGPAAVAEEDQRQHRAEEEDQVVLVSPLQRREHLPQHEERHQEAHGGHQLVQAR